MEACTKILRHFEQELITGQTFEILFKTMDLDQLSEQSIQDMLNTLP